MTSNDVQDAHWALEIPDDALIGALAREAAFTDADLAGLARQLPQVDDASAASIALALARAGWTPVAPVFAARAAADTPSARVFALAAALVAPRPLAAVEAAEAGYRFTDRRGTLYVEDPLAAHWHHRGRWGPPIRPDLAGAGRHASGPGAIDRCVRWAAEGGVVIVTFAPRWRPHSPLRLCKAGFTQDPSFRSFVRWSSLRSLGRWSEGRRGGPAYQIDGGDPIPLPTPASVPSDDLLTLMERLSALGRGPSAGAS